MSLSISIEAGAWSSAGYADCAAQQNGLDPLRPTSGGPLIGRSVITADLARLVISTVRMPSAVGAANWRFQPKSRLSHDSIES